MQPTASFHNQVADTGLSETIGVMDNATTLDAADDMLDAHATARNPSIAGFLHSREGSAPWLFGRHDDLDVVEGERQEAQILEQPTARRQGVGRRISDALIVGAAGIGLTQKEDRERRVDE